MNFVKSLIPMKMFRLDDKNPIDADLKWILKRLTIFLLTFIVLWVIGYVRNKASDDRADEFVRTHQNIPLGSPFDKIDCRTPCLDSINPPSHKLIKLNKSDSTQYQLEDLIEDAINKKLESQ